jgi:hypothetical protein
MDVRHRRILLETLTSGARIHRSDRNSLPAGIFLASGLVFEVSFY